MSQTKTTEIAGDATFGRNVNIGGSAVVRTNALVKGNLRVEGWLDARNVKASNKGVFVSYERLRLSHPRPHNGWFAGVPATESEIDSLGISAESAKGYLRLYIGVDGEWIAEPTGKLYEISIDMSILEDVEESVSGLAAASAAQGKEIEALRIDIDRLSEQSEENINAVNEAKAQSHANAEAISSLSEDIRAEQAAQQGRHDAEMQGIIRMIGASSGIAPLDESSKIPSAYLPGYVDDVVEFAEWRSIKGGVIEVLAVEAYSSKKSTDAGCSVVYHEAGRRLLLKETAGQSAIYYADWADGEAYGTESEDGRVPEQGKVYTCSMTNQTYRWSGERLVVIGTDLALGRTSSTAFPGDAGRRLEERMQSLAEDVDWLLETLPSEETIERRISETIERQMVELKVSAEDIEALLTKENEKINER